MGLFSFLKSASGSKHNPADSAMPYLNQIPGVGKKYYEPYIQQGQSADQTLQALFPELLAQRPDYSPMAKDPIGFLNNIYAQYKPTEAYNFKKNEMLKALGNSAAAGGFAGTRNDQLAQGELVQALLSGDMQQFLDNVLNIKGTGLQGQQYQADQGLAGTQGFADRGFQASSALADFLGSNLSQQGGLAFQGAAQKNANRAGLFKDLLGLGGSMFGAAGAAGSFGNLFSGPRATSPFSVPGSFKPFGTTSNPWFNPR